MAGKGSEIGRTFEEIARIYDGVVYNEKLSVCFDTCHVNDAGYDIVNNLEGVLDEFDRIIGKDQIAVFHINDSKNVLETPYIPSPEDKKKAYAPYKHEIDMIKGGTFIPALKENILHDAL